MRIDLMVSILSFTLVSLLILYSYTEAQHWIVNYDNFAWMLAEKAANLLKGNRNIDTNAYIIVTLILPNGTISRHYTIGVKPQVVLGKAYTYRILGNNTLMRVEVWITSTECYVNRS